MGIAAIIALGLTYLAGVAWFALAQWLAIELDGERRVGVSIRIVLAAVLPLTILVATCAVLARQLSGHPSAAASLTVATPVESGSTASAANHDVLVRIFSPRDAAR
jgi:hypothetical protein